MFRKDISGKQATVLSTTRKLNSQEKHDIVLFSVFHKKLFCSCEGKRIIMLIMHSSPDMPRVNYVNIA